MPRNLAKPDRSPPGRPWTLRRYMLASGFFAVDFAVVGSLIKSTNLDGYLSLIAGVLTAGYLIAVFVVIDQPDESLEDPDRSTRKRPTG